MATIIVVTDLGKNHQGILKLVGESLKEYKDIYTVSSYLPKRYSITKENNSKFAVFFFFLETSLWTSNVMGQIDTISPNIKH